MALLDGLKHEPLTNFDLSHFCAMASGVSVKHALDQMREQKRNCTFVLQDDRLIGILTDRDVLRRIVDDPELWEQAVDTVMTPKPLTIQESATAADAMHLMHANHFRNVPVMRANGEIAGNFTYYAVLALLADSFPAEIYNRPPDPTRVARRRHGA